MLKSMYSGISGMKANQTRIDVIGNNIANVGTTAFKSSTAKFQDMLSQNISDATAPTATQGGLNSQQVGLGVQLSSIDTVMTQGTLNSTGRALDLAIDGDSQFFMVSKGPSIYGDSTLQVSHRAGSHGITDQSLANSGSEMMYTRDGSFILDQQGNLLTSKGYRVLGYAVTNDDNGLAPTSKSPSDIGAFDMNFKLGPGTQLNGYKFTLGTISAGTATSADIDTASKTIVVNGDFTTDSTLTADQVTSAINKGLSGVGISQRVTAYNPPHKYDNVNTKAISGGSDATAPNTVSLAGFTFKFTEGSGLNGYSLELGKINQSGQTTASLITSGTKMIKINGDFLTSGNVSIESLRQAINDALKTNGISQTVTVTGQESTLSQLVTKADNAGTKQSAPGGTFGTSPSITFGMVSSGTNLLSNTGATRSYSADGTKGSQLNGYTFEISQDSTKDAATAPAVSIDASSRKIKVVVSTNTTSGSTVADSNTISTAINDKLYDSGIQDVQVTSVGSATTSGSVTITANTATSNTLGVDLASPSTVNLNGLKITLPKGVDFNNTSIKIVDIDGPDAVNFVPATATTGTPVQEIQISSNFRDPNVDITHLESLINDKLKTYYSASSLSDSQSVNIQGSPKAITGLDSNSIDGGADLKAPVQPDKPVFGMNFTIGAGSALNGYQITIGKVTSGTQTSAKVDEASKTISINGDFTSGTLTTTEVQRAIASALKDKGIDQTIKVSSAGAITTLTGIPSDEAAGGTPIESLDADGNVSFIDGSKKPKAFDGTLKSLKIPDKIKIAGTDTELKVKSFSIDSTGVINCALEDGSTAAVGQIALASFKNPEGLQKLGGNLYTKSANSGDAIVKSGLETKGDDNSKGFGQVLGGMLELSNVDLAAQFTDMITATRAFQASGKMINTGDEILQEIINLKR
ncbi:flagellar hook-basal body complex protein [Inconstantimicrobium mannanitabidum]|uniref:flagellar hook-basal body complex protein n=1 Tax=Inconstantimicrobium mannanitabidum TaxID=1604901 RepID=UPI0021C2FDAB